MRLDSTFPRTLARRALLVGIVAGFLGFGAAGCGGTSSAPSTTTEPTPPKGTWPGMRSITLVDRTWFCDGPVNLNVVRVVMHGTHKDAVHLDQGCTGSIQSLQVVGDGGALGPAGDGVKVHPGAHDLQIMGGFINCGKKSRGKHQDAIQAMGGRNVVFHNITSRGCISSFMFINWGRLRAERPTGILCVHCRAETSHYSLFVGNSTDSGAKSSSFVSRARPRVLRGAVQPILSGNTWTERAAAAS